MLSAQRAQRRARATQGKMGRAEDEAREKQENAEMAFALRMLSDPEYNSGQTLKDKQRIAAQIKRREAREAADSRAYEKRREAERRAAAKREKERQEKSRKEAAAREASERKEEARRRREAGKEAARAKRKAASEEAARRRAEQAVVEEGSRAATGERASCSWLACWGGRRSGVAAGAKAPMGSAVPEVSGSAVTAVPMGSPAETAPMGSPVGHPPMGKAVMPMDGEAAACAVCQARPMTHCFVPCGHRCVCADCAAQLMAQGTPATSGAGEKVSEKGAPSTSKVSPAERKGSGNAQSQKISGGGICPICRAACSMAIRVYDQS